MVGAHHDLPRIVLRDDHQRQAVTLAVDLPQTTKGGYVPPVTGPAGRFVLAGRGLTRIGRRTDCGGSGCSRAIG